MAASHSERTGNTVSHYAVIFSSHLEERGEWIPLEVYQSGLRNRDLLFFFFFFASPPGDFDVGGPSMASITVRSESETKFYHFPAG